MIYYGIDLHKKYSYVASIDKEGSILFQRKVSNHKEVSEKVPEFGPPKAGSTGRVLNNNNLVPRRRGSPACGGICLRNDQPRKNDFFRALLQQ